MPAYWRSGPGRPWTPEVSPARQFCIQPKSEVKSESGLGAWLSSPRSDVVTAVMSHRRGRPGCFVAGLPSVMFFKEGAMSFLHCFGMVFLASAVTVCTLLTALPAISGNANPAPAASAPVSS